MSSKNALIIGATSDIASATSVLLAQKGFSLTLTSRNVSKLYNLKNSLSAVRSQKHNILELDILNTSSFETFLNQIDETPDLVLFCPGLMESSKNNLTDEEILKVIHTNFSGPVLFLNKLLEKFKNREKMTLIMLSSVSGERGRSQNIFYGPSKSGLTAYSSSIRQKFHGSNISVITVKLGFVDTKMTKNLNLPKILTSSPEQIAKLIYSGFKHQKDIIYSSKWRLIMFIVKSIPETVFKRLNF